MMELAQLTIRDWMVIAGVLLIFAVLLDAYRRVRNERNTSVRMKLADPEDREAAREVDLAWLKELPNGGARVVNRAEEESVAAAAVQPAAAEFANTAPNIEQAPERPTADIVVEDVELVSGMNAVQEPENIDWLDGLETDEAPTQTGTVREHEEPPRLPRELDPEVFMLNVVARSPAGFNGGDILHILLACDLRFGDMSFFHRHEHEAGLGAIQFSVANMMQPGVFDLDEMSDMNTPGLVFFLTLPGPEDMMQAFDYMLETAQTVARNLQGDVLDESRSAMTSQTLGHSRQKIRDLERRMLTRAER